jgi:Mn-dependent DtxR family transcriptional regulator
MLASIEAIESGVDKYMAGSQFEAVVKAILAALRGARGGSLFRADVLKRRGVSKADERVVDGAIKRLQEAGDIERTDGKKLTLTPAGWG